MSKLTKEQLEAKLKDYEKNISLKTTAMICVTILGFINIIGIFWGKDGLVVLGQAFIVFCLIMLWALSSYFFKPSRAIR